jgi:hypothetical protein
METLIDLAIVITAFTAAWILHRLGRADDLGPPHPTTPPKRQLHADLAAYQALRDSGIEQEPGDPYSDDRINAELLFIPHQTHQTHQTRRTEEDQ